MPRNNAKRPAKRAMKRQAQMTASTSYRRTIVNSGLPPLVPDPLPMQISPRQHITILRSYNPAILGGQTTLDTFGSYQFSLDALPGYTELTALFDQYRFLQVIVRFVPVNPNFIASPIVTVIDYDDATTPTSMAQLLEYSSAMTVAAHEECTRVISPMAAQAVYTGSAFTGYAALPRTTWLDAASANTKYYGLKYGIPALSTTSSGATYSVFTTVVVQCRFSR